MLRLPLLLALALCAARPSTAQHAHGHAPGHAGEATLATGFRVAPDALPPGSGLARAAFRWADGAYATVVFGQPWRRGRDVFGGLVAYDHVWAAGAHRATELWTTAPLVVGAATLAPGGYSLFVTPRATGAWTVHVNRALGMHLADDYDAALDVATVDVAPERVEAPAEALTWAFAPDGAALTLAWDRTRLVVPLARP